jgi:transcriptional regulator with XRE-family HTH domain
MPSISLDWWTMGFGKRLAALRKERSMTQQTLADRVGCHVTMVRRYEAEETQPTLEVIRNLARALSVSADTLVFDDKERDPTDELRLQFEAVSQLPLDEQAVVKDVLESLLLKYQARRWEQARAAVAAAAAAVPAKKVTPKRTAHAIAR